MKRVKIVATFLFLIELAGFILVGKFLYHKETIQLTDKVARDINIRGKDSTDKTVITFNTGCVFCHDFHVGQEVRLTDNELKEFEKTKSVKISWWNLHALIWIILYYALVILGGIPSIVAFISGLVGDCDNCHLQRNSYRCSEDCLFRLRCALYEKVNDINLEPTRIKWYKFWGYETSSSNINLSNNC